MPQLQERIGLLESYTPASCGANPNRVRFGPWNSAGPQIKSLGCRTPVPGIRLALAMEIEGTLMNVQEIVSQCSAAAEEFNLNQRRDDGLQVTESLCGGLTLVRDTFFDRVHADVEVCVGKDSIFLPISEEKTERTTKMEIEAYLVAVSAATADDRAYVADAAWYRDWLVRLRLENRDADGLAARRVVYYAGKSATDQRLAFSNVLATVLPESAVRC